MASKHNTEKMTEANVTNQFAGNVTKDTLTENLQYKPDCDSTEAAKIQKEKLTDSQVNNKELNKSNLELVFNLTATKANVNKIQSDDTLMKYIYKGDENKIIADKESGHQKNSLKRRKRSEHTPHSQIIQNPANFKYSTVHNVGNQGELNDQGIRTDIIQSADLADFNIETLHPNTPTTETYSQLTGDSETDSVPDSRQNEDNNSYQNSNEDASTNEEFSREEPNNELTSNEHEVNSSDKNYEKSNENDKEAENDNSENKEYSDEGEDKHYPSEHHNDKYRQHSSDESSENYESSEKGRDLNSNHIFESKGNSAQENSNENQSLKPASDEDNSSFIESSESPQNSPYLEKQVNATNEKFTSDIDPNFFLTGSTENSDEKSQTLINDGEVKPVIEQNDEDNSDELSKEAGDAPHSLPLQKNGKEGNINSLNRNEDDVKQQFERIPLNYKHKDENLEKNERGDAPLHNSDTLESKSDETDEKLNSTDFENEKYDKNLNFKFDVVPIKLPEIKLPDDILDYAYEPAHKNEDEDEDSKTHKPIKSDKKWSYYTYNPDLDNYDLDLDEYNNKRKSKYSDKIADRKNGDDGDEEDEDEDLYEKFVRERFGKRGSFAKRSEKLRAKPEVDNRELYNTIQSVLKRTEDIQKEADKSADPNANYLWTLEYGEKL